MFKTVQEIRTELQRSLQNIPPFKECVHLDWPNHPNTGDHMIWLGEVDYLKKVRRAKIRYTASCNNFSDEKFEKFLNPKTVIFLHGGGNLGNLYPNYQSFREKIIRNYSKNPIVIFPQTLYFQDNQKLEKASAIFNSHPNLTIFLRDQVSYDIASQIFSKCKVLKSPDMAFQLAVQSPILQPERNFSIFYLWRGDNEIDQAVVPQLLEVPNLKIGDWFSFCQRSVGNRNKFLKKAMHFLHVIYSIYNRLLKGSFQNQRSTDLLRGATNQFKKYGLIITSRLHGHILASVMGIPNILVPNSYYKNKAFYETWTKDLPFCRFADTPQKVKSAVEELQSIYCRGFRQFIQK